MSLSDHIDYGRVMDKSFIHIKYIKQFIQELKAGVFSDKGKEMGFVKFIDEKAGEALI